MKLLSVYIDILLVYVTGFHLVWGDIHELNNTANSDSNLFFAEKLIESYGSNDSISASQIDKLLATLNQGGHSLAPGVGNHGNSDGQMPGSTETDERETCLGEKWMLREECLLSKCLEGRDLLVLASAAPDSHINATQLSHLAPALLYSAQNQDTCNQDVPAAQHSNSAAEVWGYSFLCVTAINLCSLVGMVFFPLMRRTFYHKLLMFMVALAVGTLTGSSLLFLIPSCFDFSSEHSPHFDMYIWQCSTIIGGIYLFFLVERLLKLIIDHTSKSEKSGQVTHIDPEVADLYARAMDTGDDKTEIQGSIPTHAPHRHETMNMTFDLPGQVSHGKASRSCQCHLLGPNIKSTDTPIANVKSETTTPEPANGIHTQTPVDETDLHLILQSKGVFSKSRSDHTPSDSHTGSTVTDLRHVRSVAWMVIFGDGLHNFIDGLSIGAAFSQSVLSGVSISLAVICEELPHELGDFAILLNSGLSIRQALSFNFLSACMCYLGLAVGILVGELSSGSTWIFAIAGGMFLYIALVDMLPEVNVAAEEDSKKGASPWKIFLLQNTGLICGYTIMVLLAIFGERIRLDSHT